ncbi:hypothetical protein HK101_002978 [Irineochytrium annulatum]|nr:hypothetical protein HK101_002978 [Irineochytrium annulatum]
MEAASKNSAPPSVSLVITFDPHSTPPRLLCGPPDRAQSLWSFSQHRSHCRHTILTALSVTEEHPHRCFYALAHAAFTPAAPRPIGGKRYPGYSRFRCKEPIDVLDWLLDVSLAPEWEVGRRKPPHPSTLLCVVVEAVNGVLEAHFKEEKGAREAMNEGVLVGMKRAGVISRIGERTSLPEYLRERRGERGPRGDGTAGVAGASADVGATGAITARDNGAEDDEEIKALWESLLTPDRRPASKGNKAMSGSRSNQDTIRGASLQRSVRDQDEEPHHQIDHRGMDHYQRPPSLPPAGTTGFGYLDYHASPYVHPYVDPPFSASYPPSAFYPRPTNYPSITHPRPPTLGPPLVNWTPPVPPNPPIVAASASTHFIFFVNLDSDSDDDDDEFASGAPSSSPPGTFAHANDPPRILAELLEIHDTSLSTVDVRVAARYVLLPDDDGGAGEWVNWWRHPPSTASASATGGSRTLVVRNQGRDAGASAEASEAGTITVEACDEMTRRWLQVKMQAEVLRRRLGFDALVRG